MQILFAISIFSFLVLVIAGIAIVRHIREDHTKIRNAPVAQHDFSQHFLGAVSNPDLQAPQMYRQQSVQEITAKKLRDAHSKLVEISPSGERQSILDRRKPAQSARPRAEERLDWAYFNKDYGDLSDPFPSRRFRVRPNAKSTSNRRA